MIKVFSYGGGVQSTAALVLAAQGKIDYQDFVFCNVGHDSENPHTLDYVHQHAIPYATAHGLRLVEIHKTRKDGTRTTIYQQLTRDESRSIGIPVRMSGSGAPGHRTCTLEFKVELCDMHIKKQLGVGKILAKERRYHRMIEAIVNYSRSTVCDEQAIEQLINIAAQCIKMPRPLAQIALGISTDEFHRARNDSGKEWKQLVYPLLELGLSRQDCKGIIVEAGLPLPSESSCYFCPMHTTDRWIQMRQEDATLFEKAADLEEYINKKREKLGMDAVYFHRALKPLRMAIPIESTLVPATITEAEEQERCTGAGGCFL